MVQAVLAYRAQLHRLLAIKEDYIHMNSMRIELKMVKNNYENLDFLRLNVFGEMFMDKDFLRKIMEIIKDSQMQALWMQYS